MAEEEIEAARVLQICNACRYCEGYCAVFPALERRRTFEPGDVAYLANLCHDCRACFYACMYAPPHEFGVNIPRALAAVREQTYARYALPRIVGTAARRHAVLLVLATLAFALFFVAASNRGQLFVASTETGSFYAVVPYLAMALPALLVGGFALAVMVLDGVRFARSVGGAWLWRVSLAALVEGVTLRYLQGGAADGCTYPSGRSSYARLWLHMLVFYGFLCALIATIAAFVLQDFLGVLPPYPLLSVPVVLGSVGGVGMIVGSTGLLWLKWRSDRAPADPGTVALDWLFLVSLDVVSITGMLLLMFRETPAMGVLLILHLATVLALFI